MLRILLLTIERHHQARPHNVMRWCHKTSLAKLLYNPPLRVLCPLFSGLTGLALSSCLLYRVRYLVIKNLAVLAIKRENAQFVYLHFGIILMYCETHVIVKIWKKTTSTKLVFWE